MNRRLALSLAGTAALSALIAACMPISPATKDIVETATEAGQFTTLVAALSAANLVDTLKGPGPFTVFAPTDAAFAALPAGTLDALLLPENRDQLVSILTYHVVPGTVTANQWTDQRRDLATVQGQFLHIDAEDDDIVRVNTATVTQTDIRASNGVIHVINQVLLPR
jgi:uncharacterized surface protein with fasciclin (FAS1) repeats